MNKIFTVVALFVLIQLARHVSGITIKNCTFNYEKRDSRYTLFLDDVLGGTISSIKTVRANDINSVIKLKNSKDVNISDVIYFNDEWGKLPANLKVIF